MTNDSTILKPNQDIFSAYNNFTKTEIMTYFAIIEMGGDALQSELAELVGVTDRKIREAIKKLKAAKVLKVAKVGRQNEYFFAPIEERKQEQTEVQEPEILPINNNDKISTDKKELSPDVFNNLQTLGIKNLPQTRTSFSRKVTKKRTPNEWLLLHDPEGAIAGRVSAWAEFKANGGLIDVNPVLLWLNVLQGIEPPTPNAELSEIIAEPDANLTEPLQDADIADALPTDAAPGDAIAEDAPEDADPLSNIWQAHLEKLALSMAKSIYDSHLADTRLIRLNNEKATVQAKKRSVDYLNNRLGALVGNVTGLDIGFVRRQL